MSALADTFTSLRIDGFDTFPDQVYVIEKSRRHLIINCTPASSGDAEQVENVHALVVFESEEQAKQHAVRAFRDFTPRIVTFEAAREIAISKPAVSALALMRDMKTMALHWVR